MIIFLCQAFFRSEVFREEKLIENASNWLFSEGKGEGNGAGIRGKCGLNMGGTLKRIPCGKPKHAGGRGQRGRI